MIICNHKILSLCAASLLAAVQMQGERISATQAHDIAAGFVTARKAQFKPATGPVNTVPVYAPEANGETLFYIFNNSNDNGFTIVSADDRLPQVLGYTTSGTFDQDLMPENMRWWLSEYAREIDWFFTHQDDSHGPARKIELGDAHSIAPLMTTTWDQGQPYNDDCPDSPSGRTYTGCVATGMAQVMNYYEWPPQGVGSRNDISFETPYDWANMLDSYRGEYNEVQAAAVAKLMRHCGAAVDMSYSTSGSGATDAMLHYAILNHFNYNPGTRILFRDYIGLNEWENLVYNEIANNGPVIMCGQANGGGHCFVVDGYQGDGYFHLNWGWSGYQDGYFLLYSLNPASGGAGSFEGGYNSDQSIIVDMTPAGVKDTAPQHLLIAGTGIAYAPANHAIEFEGERNALAYNPIGTLQRGTCYIAFEKADDPDNVVYAESFDIELPTYYGLTSLQFSDPELSDGDYKVYPVWLPESTMQMEKICIPTSYAQYIPAKVEGGKISYMAAQLQSSDAKIIPTAVIGIDNIYEGVNGNFSIEVANVSESGDYSGVIGVELISKDNESKVHRFGVNTTIAAGRSKKINMSAFHGRAAGEYTMKLLCGSSDNLSYFGDVYDVTVKPALTIDVDASQQPKFQRFDLAFAETGEEVSPIISLKNTSKKVQKFNFILKITDAEQNEVARYTTGEIQLLANKEITAYFNIGELNVPAGHYFATGAINDIKNGVDDVPIGGLYPLTVTRYGGITADEIAYRVISESDHTARLAAPDMGHYSEEVIVPEVVDGEYVIDRLDGTAFTFNRYVTDVTIPSTVRHINSGTFYHTSSLKSLTFTSSEPPTLGTEAFNEQNARTTAIRLPAGAAPAYHAAKGWNQFHIPAWTIQLLQDVTLAAGRDSGSKLYVSSDEEPVIALSDPGQHYEARIVLTDGSETLIMGEGSISLPALGLLDGICQIGTDLSVVKELLGENGKIDIYTTSGVMVRAAATATDIETLPAGIYIAGGRKLIKH